MTNEKMGLTLHKEYKVVEFFAVRQESEAALANINADGAWTLESTVTATSYDEPVVVMVFSRQNFSIADSL